MASNAPAAAEHVCTTYNLSEQNSQQNSFQHSSGNKLTTMNIPLPPHPTELDDPTGGVVDYEDDYHRNNGHARGKENGGRPKNNFHIRLADLTLDRYYAIEAPPTPTHEEEEEDAKHHDKNKPQQQYANETTKSTVESSAFTSLSPAAVARETELVLNTLEPGHLYNNSSAPIGVPEPRPEQLIQKGMNEVTNITNKLATALVVADHAAVVYETSRREVLLWRRWNDIHPNPTLFGDEVLKKGSDEGDATANNNNTNSADGLNATPRGGPVNADGTVDNGDENQKANTSSRRAAPNAPTYTIPTIPSTAIHNLLPLPLKEAIGGIEHPTFVPTFQPSIMDDHFFLLGLSAAISQDASVLAKAFASVEHLDDKGLLTIRLYSDQRIELPKIEGVTVAKQRSGPAAKGAAKRRLTRSLNGTMRNSMNSTTALDASLGGTAATLGGTGSSSHADAQSGDDGRNPSTLVTLPVYLTLDTMLPVSKATSDTIAPAQLDLAVGRTYDAINEFWVAFLAKAFATMKGSYQSLHGGSAIEVLRALVPGEGKYVRWNDELFNIPVVMDALRRVTGGGKARSIGATIDAEKVEEAMMMAATSNSRAASAASGRSDGSASPPFGHNPSDASLETHPLPAANTTTAATEAPTEAAAVPPAAAVVSAAAIAAGKRVSIMDGPNTTSNGRTRSASPHNSSQQQPRRASVSFNNAVAPPLPASSLRPESASQIPPAVPEIDTADDDYRAVAEAALNINAARKNAEELWWLLQEATLGSQPMLLTNTNKCKDSIVDETQCSFGNVPPPIKDTLLHCEEWNKFNWSYGVVVLAAVELDTSMAIADGYLKAVRRRSKRNQGEVRRLVKVRSVFRSNHPDYAKLRGEWSLPNGGGRTVVSETYNDNADGGAEAAATAALLKSQIVEEMENDKINGGNPNWTAFAQEYLQYNVAEVIEKQSEDTVWWMTVDEVCRNFNCFFTLYNTHNSSGAIAPPRLLVDTVAALAKREDEARRKPRDPFQAKPKQVNPKDGTLTNIKIAAGDDQFPEEPHFESSPSALLKLLKAASTEDTTAMTSDTLTKLVPMTPSPAISTAFQHFPHLLLHVNKVESLDDFGRKITLPEGTDIRFKSIFDVKPNPLEMGDETDDEEKSRGMGGTMTSRTGSAVDITVNPQNALQIEVRVSVPKTLAARRDFCVQLYRVTGPHRQACIKTIKDGKPTLSFPLHTKVQVRSLPTSIVTTAIPTRNCAPSSTLPSSASGGGMVGINGLGDTVSVSSHASWGGASASSYVSSASSSASSFASSSSSGGGGFSRAFTFECDVNTGFYNVVIMPDPETTAGSNMAIQDASLVQVSVTKRLNGESFSIDLTELPL